MINKTKKILGVSALILMGSVQMPTFASVLNTSVNVSLNNTLIGQGYLNEKGNTMIPLRLLSEKLGYNVSWDGQNQVAHISEGDNYIEFTVGYHNAKTNTGSIQLSSNPEMQNNSVYIPLRVAGDALGLEVGYSNKTAYLSTENSTIELPTNIDKQIPFTEVTSLLLGNGYNQHGLHGINFFRREPNEAGEMYQISSAQVIPEEPLLLLNLHYKTETNLEFAKLVLNSLVPGEAANIYNLIETRDDIPLTLFHTDGYHIAVYTDSGLYIAIDGSANANHIQILKKELNISTNYSKE